MDQGHLLRRLVHLCTPLFLVYYWLPPKLGTIDKPILLLILLVVVLNFEYIRIHRQWRIIGMREYEAQRMSAAAWAALAMAFAFLFFPVEYAAPAVIGMGLIDPLIGELRSRKSNLYPALPTVLHFAIVLTTLSVMIGFDYRAVLATLVATPLAIYFEKTRWRFIDDDFLMIVLPLLGIAAVYYLTSSLF
jgi:hypothetical protein